jgi:antitoxin component YwqK of YwqJK toxin-antitoxin module
LRAVDSSVESASETLGPRAPERPSGVPATGAWNAEVEKWEVCARDASGEREGERLLYRGDGSLYSRSRFAGGVPEGPFAVYHPNGDVAREGRYIGGQLDGVISCYASRVAGGEHLRACCVPREAARLDIRYRRGEMLLEVFYDAEGRAILSDGRLCPARPPSLPELAQFDEARWGWAQRSGSIDRLWSEDGTLTQEIEREHDGARVERKLDASGQVVSQYRFAADDTRDGPFQRQLPSDEPGPYADARISHERGTYARGQAVGEWTFSDAAGAVVRTVDRGLAFDDDAGSAARPAAVFAAAGDWPALARELFAARRVREALAATARAAVAARDRDALARAVAEHVVPLAAERAAQWGEALTQSTSATPSQMLDALICGADPASVFRGLASVAPGTSAAAADFVEASLLLAPERHMTHLTRALLRFQRGDQAGAMADAAVVERESAEAAESLRTYAETMFRPFDSWPARESFGPDPELADVVVEPAQPLEAVRHLIGVYATRLARTRDAIRALLDGGDSPSWLPPDPAALLPDGPVALRRERIECDPDDQGTVETIDINEEVDADGAGVPVLLGIAHQDWAALSWLSWAVGLGAPRTPAELRMPDAVSPPAELAAAMKMIVRRTWRIKDRLTTGSLVSRSQGVPGFDWQGVDVDELPQHFAELAAGEYVATRSMFLWLASADALSPFQDDIRDA